MTNENCQLYWYLVYTHDGKNCMNVATRWFTGGPGHVNLAYRKCWMAKEPGAEDGYFECTAKKDVATGYSGFQGPKEMVRISDWQAQDRVNRFMIRQPERGYLPLSQFEAWDAYAACCGAVKDRIGYAHFQLLGNAISALLRMQIHFGRGTPKRWTCCEAPVRTGVIPARAWRHLGFPSITADDLFPGGHRYQSLYAGVERWLAGMRPGERDDIQ